VDLSDKWKKHYEVVLKKSEIAAGTNNATAVDA